MRHHDVTYGRSSNNRIGVDKRDEYVWDDNWSDTFHTCLTDVVVVVVCVDRCDEHVWWYDNRSDDSFHTRLIALVCVDRHDEHVWYVW